MRSAVGVAGFRAARGGVCGWGGRRGGECVAGDGGREARRGGGEGVAVEGGMEARRGLCGWGRREVGGGM